MKIKVCGMKYPENIQSVAELQPGYMGFIFYDKSKRYVGADFIPPTINPEIRKVAVFVNHTFEQITQTNHGAGIIQLHGEETPELCFKLRTEWMFTIVKAFSIDENFDFKQLEKYKSVVDYFLFDTKGKEKGGNGVAFDWEILKQYDNEIPLWMSGGIGLDNIHLLLRFIEENQLNVETIDVNSRFETEPGLKDIESLKQLVRICRDVQMK